MATRIKPRTLDFSNVKESSGINPKHVEEGDYPAKCVGVKEQESKKGDLMWVFLFTPDDYRSATYPEYCVLKEDNLWKLRNIFIAAGLGKLVSGKKAAKVDPNLVVGKRLGITLVDDEHEGKMKSTIEAFLPISELEDGDDPEVDDQVDDVDEVDEDEEEEPAPVKKKRKPAPEPEPEEDDEDEEDEEPEEKPVSKRTARRRAAKAAAAEADDEDEDEEEEAPAPKKRAKKKAAPAPVEDEDDDLDIDLDDDEL